MRQTHMATAKKTSEKKAKKKASRKAEQPPKHKRPVEWSRTNKFPFNTRQQSVSVCFDNHEDLTDLDFIYSKIIERHPALMAEKFYSKVQDVYDLDLDEATVVSMMKPLCDGLLADIREFLADEDFVHLLHDKFGFGIDKVI